MRKKVLVVLASLTLAAGGYACSGVGSDDPVTSTPAGDTPVTAEAGAPTETATEPTKVATVPVGQGLTVTEDLFGTKSTVVLTVSAVKANVKSGNQFITPSKGQFVQAEVSAVVQAGKVSVSWAQFKLVAADGTVFEPTIMGDGLLDGNDLTPGQKTSGRVVFDAAVGAEKGAKIAIKSWLAEGDAGYWQLP